MSSGQARAPIVDMLAAYRRRRPVELCCPGHRGGSQTDAETVALLGAEAYLHDVTQVPEIDDLLEPQGAIAEAQALAAALWGARQTHFLVNGTSSGVQAAFLAVCREGDRVAVPRASHRSVVEGLILSGAVPEWIACPLDPVMGCAVPPPPAAVRAAARDARMLVLTRPTYHGDVTDLLGAGMAGGTIILADEAWGAHLGFHPGTPSGACRSGADVVVNSTHKTAGALSGGSMLHLCSDRVDAERLASATRLLTTTSPWYGILASLDGARRDLAARGAVRVGRSLAAAAQAREELQSIHGIDVAGPSRVDQFEGVSAYDETRLVFSPARAGWSGSALADALREEAGIEVELADGRCVIANVCGEADAAHLDLLVTAVRRVLAGRAPGGAPLEVLRTGITPVLAASPREAWQAPRERVPLRQARGRVAAEMVCPYPPGVPLLSYGERITDAVIDALEVLRGSAVRVQGSHDATLATLVVVR